MPRSANARSYALSVEIARVSFRVPIEGSRGCCIILLDLRVKAIWFALLLCLDGFNVSRTGDTFYVSNRDGKQQPSKMKAVIVILFFVGCLVVAVGYVEQVTRINAAIENSSVEYRYVPRTMDQEQWDSTAASDIYRSMELGTSSPWMNDVAAVDPYGQETDLTPVLENKEQQQQQQQENPGSS